MHTTSCERFLALLFTLFLPVQVLAASITWDGGGAGTAWGTALNWSTDTVPTANDTAIFNGTSTKNVTLTGGTTIAAIDIQGGYTGTMTVNSSVTLATSSLKIGSSSATVRLGTGATLILDGTGTPLSGTGTLDATTNSSTNVIYAGSGTVNVAASTPASAYRNLTLKRSTNFSHVGTSAITAKPGIRGIALDSTNGFLYVGDNASTNGISKVRLSDLTEVSTLTSLGRVTGLAIDADSGFLYAMGPVQPGTIRKIRLSDFTLVNTLTLASTEGYPLVPLIDTANGYLYVHVNDYNGTGTSYIVKIRLSDFTRVAAVTLGTHLYSSYSAAHDSGSGYGYWGTCDVNNAERIYKVNLSALTLTSTLTLGAGYNCLSGAAIDEATGFAYFGIYTDSKILKVRLSDFTVSAALTTVGKVDDIVLDATNGYLYVGEENALIERIRLSDFTKAGSISVPSGNLYPVIRDPATGYGYFFPYSSGNSFKLDLSNTAASFRLGTASSQNLTAQGSLTIGNTGVTSPTLTVSAALYNPAIQVSGSASILAGASFTAPASSAFTVAGNWSNAGTFTANGGTVTLNGSNQAISGTTTFYNLMKTVTTAATLTFAASVTQTITNILTLRGAEYNLLSLRSSSTGTKWKIDPQGTRNLAHIDVNDSNNLNAAAIDCTSINCMDSGNNTNWTFPSNEPRAPRGGHRGHGAALNQALQKPQQPQKPIAPPTIPITTHASSASAKPVPRHLLRAAERKALLLKQGVLAQSQPEGEPMIRFAGTTLNFRAGPSMEAKVIGLLQQGTPLTILSLTPVWAEVRSADGKTGFVARRYLRK